jgi:toxin ParE1/3/4
MRIRWTMRAAEHLKQIHQFIGKDNETAATETVRMIVAAADKLLLNPRQGSPGKKPGTRELPISPYVVVYRVVEDVINIQAVWHGAQLQK